MRRVAFRVKHAGTRRRKPCEASRTSTRRALKAFAKGGGHAAPLTMAEQILREKGRGALAALEKAKASGDPVAIAQARVPAERVQAELQKSERRSRLAGRDASGAQPVDDGCDGSVTVMAKVVVLSKPEPPDALQSRRAELMAEAQRLGKVHEARATIERRLQGTGRRADDASTRASGRRGAHGPRTTPKARRPSRKWPRGSASRKRRALLANDLTGALAGQKAVEPRLAALHAELRDVMLEGLRAPGRRAARRRPTRSTRPCTRRRRRLSPSPSRRTDCATRRRGDWRGRSTAADREREAILRAAFSRLEQLEQPKMAGDAAERARHATDYRRRLR